MHGLSQYTGAAALGLGLVVKAPDLLRHRRDPLMRSAGAVMALAMLSLLLGAPQSVAAVNRVSGVANLAAPLTYSVITAFSAACLVLIVHWRGGPNVCVTARRWVLGYTVLVAGIVTVFALGDAPVERRTDFDTYYAGTPFIREMILLYLAGDLMAAAATMVLCWRWAREVRGWTHAGLRLLALGAVGNTAFGVAKLTAVAARWSGRDWATLSTDASPPLAAVAGVLAAGGYIIPLLGPRLSECVRAWRSYVRLGPLERELDPVLTGRHLRAPHSRELSPAARLLRRETSIHNALAHLLPAFDDGLRRQTREAVLRAGGDGRQAEAVAWAAVIAAAVRGETVSRGTRVPALVNAGDHQLPSPADLLGISRALGTSSPFVAAARGTAVLARDAA